MKKLFTILLVLISFSTFAQFEAGEYINSDTVKIDGVPLLLNAFLKDSLGGAGNIFYSTGASSQPASGSVNQVIGGNSLSVNYLPKWDGNKFANSVITEVNGKIGINRQNPSFFDLSTEYDGTIATTKLRLQETYLDNGWFGVQLRAYDIFTPRDILENWRKFIEFCFYNFGKTTLVLSSNSGDAYNLQIAGVNQMDNFVMSGTNPKILPLTAELTCLITDTDFTSKILKVVHEGEEKYIFVTEAQTTDNLDEQKIKGNLIQFLS